MFGGGSPSAEQHTVTVSPVEARMELLQLVISGGTEQGQIHICGLIYKGQTPHPHGWKLYVILIYGKNSLNCCLKVIIPIIG